MLILLKNSHADFLVTTTHAHESALLGKFYAKCLFEGTVRTKILRFSSDLSEVQSFSTESAESRQNSRPEKVRTEAGNAPSVELIPDRERQTG